jgi:NAD(P)-dependent dehydrogenase (short-subunit alcohol dehydrogenase family)
MVRQDEHRPDHIISLPSRFIFYLKPTGDDMKDFKGKTAFVTGGAEGIGYCIGRMLARQGMNVMLSDIDTKMLTSAVNTLQSEGLSVQGVALVVTLKDEWIAAAEKTLDAFGKVHMLVGNAGVSSTGAQHTIGENNWRWVLEVNLLGLVFGGEVFIPLLKSHGEGGYILNVASMAGIQGVSYSGPYCASKAAAVSLSESWRAELQKDGIVVSVLCPGFVKSRVYDSMRNRQERFGGPVYFDDLVQAKPKRAFNKELVVTGIDTDIVAHRVLEALQAEEFYIFTHPHYREMLERRIAALTEALEKTEASPALKDLPRKGRILS